MIHASGPPSEQTIAYLNTRYPALSHTFIENEIRALEAEGVRVVPFSIRCPPVEELGEGADLRERNRTQYLLGGILGTAGRMCLAIAAAPLRAGRVFLHSQRLSPGGLRMRVRHIAYALEAVLLARGMRKHALRHVHVHMGNNGAMVALLASIHDARLSYSLTIHGPSEFFDVTRLRLAEKARCARFVRFISNCGRAQTMAYTPHASWSKYHIVRCGIDPNKFPMTPRTPVPGQLKLLTVARLAPVKGLPILLQALRTLLDKELHFELRIVGDGPEQAALGQLAAELGVSHVVEFVGPLPPDRVRAEIAQADLFVLPSFAEGVPVVFMEAMASGLPVVAARVGGVAELVDDGVTGHLVEPGSVESLVEVLAGIHANPARTLAMTQPAHVKVVRDFHGGETGVQMKALFGHYVNCDAS